MIRTALLQATAGLAVLAGAALAFQQLAEDRQRATAEQARATADRELTRQGQASERFTRAIDQLGSNRREVQIGAIYGLEQIALQAPDNGPAIIEVLVAYLHRRAALPATPSPNVEQMRSRAPDVQAALTVLGRRRVGASGYELDLQDLDLSGAYLLKANLAHADMENTDLRRASLGGARLSGVDFSDADLQRAALYGADLNGATLSRADLREADLLGADLRDANLFRADLRGANLPGADLRKANMGIFGTALAGANLQGADLSGTDLRETLVGNANLSDTDLSNADLRGASLAVALAPGEHPSHARLSGANLRAQI